MKQLTILCFERGDSFFLTPQASDDAALRQVLSSYGIDHFLVLGVNPDSPQDMHEGMSIAIRVRDDSTDNIRA